MLRQYPERENRIFRRSGIVEYHIGQYHYDGVQRQGTGLGSSYEECTEHGADEREEKAVHPPVDIAGGCSGNLVGSDEQSEYLLRIDLETVKITALISRRK